MGYNNHDENNSDEWNDDAAEQPAAQAEQPVAPAAQKAEEEEAARKKAEEEPFIEWLKDHPGTTGKTKAKRTKDNILVVVGAYNDLKKYQEGTPGYESAEKQLEEAKKAAGLDGVIHHSEWKSLMKKVDKTGLNSSQSR